MILYRTQAHTGLDWLSEWFGTLIEAEAKLDALAEHGREGYIDQVDVPTNREGLIFALNHADAHRMNFPGKELFRLTEAK